MKTVLINIISYGGRSVYRLSILAFVVHLLTIVSSCEKSESTLDALAREMGDLPNSYMESALQLSFGGNYYHMTESYQGVPVRFKKAVSSEVQISATIDNTLITSYNEMFKENNPGIPEGAFAANLDGKFVMEANSTLSKDSLYVELKDADQLVDSAIYLVPVRLQVASSSAELSTSVVFFKVQVFKSELFAKMSSVTLGTSSATAANATMGYNLFADISKTVMIANNYSLKIPVELMRTFDLMDAHVTAKLYTAEADLRRIGVTASNVPFPDDIVTLSKGSALVKAGELKSTETIEVTFKNIESLTTFKNYSLIVEIEQDPNDSQSASPIPTSAKRCVLTLFLF